MRSDQRRAVPDLLLGRLGQPAGKRGPDRFARAVPARSSRSEGSARAPPRGRSRDGLPRSGSAIDSSRRSRPATTAAPAVEQGGVPEPQLVPARLLLADRPEQAVALLERPAVGRQVGRVGRRAAGGQLSRAPPGAGTASRRSGASPRARTGRPGACPARLGCPAGHAVDPDPLALTAAALAQEGNLDGRAAAGRAAVDDPLDPGHRRTPADQLGVGRRSGASGPRRAARSPRAGSSCRPRSAPRAGAVPGRDGRSSGA